MVQTHLCFRYTWTLARQLPVSATSSLPFIPALSCWLLFNNIGDMLLPLHLRTGTWDDPHPDMYLVVMAKKSHTSHPWILLLISTKRIALSKPYWAITRKSTSKRTAIMAMVVLVSMWSQIALDWELVRFEAVNHCRSQLAAKIQTYPQCVSSSKPVAMPLAW